VPWVKLSRWLISLLILFLTCIKLLAVGHAAVFHPKVWEASINPQSKERYIPVELWAGADWDGKRELKMPPVDGTYRHRTSTYYIKGTPSDRADIDGLRKNQSRREKG
jgi:hypothetical protein